MGYLQSKGINWLLIGFILISIAIHVVVFFPIIDLFKEKSVNYIEFSLEEEVKPHYRSIPRPRRRHKIPQISDTYQECKYKPDCHLSKKFNQSEES